VKASGAPIQRVPVDQPPRNAGTSAPRPVTPASGPEQVAPAAEASTGSPAASDEGYLPRPMLSRAPAPLAPVEIREPESNAPSGRYVGTLSLFIDEQGKVRGAQADEAQLPPEMARAAQEAFLAVTFSPGEIDGRKVRSRLRVEVSFDHVARVTRVDAATGAEATATSNGGAGSGEH
jgi:hypothetical protein